jgi:hypothetical protein
VVLDPSDLRRAWQDVIEMALPARGVVAAAVSPGSCTVEDRFDPVAHARRRFGLRVPDGLQRRNDVRRTDFADDYFSHRRVEVPRERGAPLRGVLGVRPRHLVGLEILLRDLLEGQR